MTAVPKKKPQPEPQRGRGRPPGSKSAEPSPYTAKVYTALTPEQKRELEKRALKRRLTDDSLSSRYGISDYLREIIEAHLSKPTK